MNSPTRRFLLGATAVSTLVVLGIAAHHWPEFKQHATTAGLVLLALISLSGFVAGLVLRHLDTRPDMTGPERLSKTVTTAAGAAHTGNLR